MLSTSAVVRQSGAVPRSGISWLSSASLMALTAMLASAPQAARGANECGAEAAGPDTVTCPGTSYANGITYAGSDGLNLILNNSAMTVTKGAAANGVSLSGTTANDLTVSATSLTSVNGGTGTAVTVTNGGDGKAATVVNGGSYTANINQGTIQATHSSGAGDSVVTLNSGQVSNTNLTGSGLNAGVSGTGTGNATVLMTGGSVQTSSGTGSVALNAVISNAASSGTASVTMTGGAMTGNGIGALATTNGSGLAQVVIDGGSISSTLTTGTFGAEANNTGSGNAVANMISGSIASGTTSTASGLLANANSGSALATMSGGTITSKAGSGAGIRASSVTGPATVSMSAGSVTETAAASYGLNARVTGASTATATVLLNGGTVSTSGNTGHGLYSQATNGQAIVQMTNGSVTASGFNATGVTASATGTGAATVLLSGGTVTTTSGSAPGLRSLTVDGLATVQMTGGTVTANGPNAPGMTVAVTGSGRYNISVTGGTVNGGGTTASAIRASSAAGGSIASSIAIGTGAIINGAASGIALDTTFGTGAATIATAGTVIGNVNLNAAANTLSITGGTIDGNINGGGNSALNFDLGSGSFAYGPPYSIGGMDSVAMNSGSAEIDGSLATNTLAVNGGRLTLNGAGTASGGATVSGGTFVVGDAAHASATLTGSLDVLAAGRLQGFGTIVGDVGNAGVIAPGNSIGTLTVAGNYTGNGGTLEIETVLGNDASATDRLVVTGNTSGSTNLKVINVGGGGAQTVEGIKIVDVGGASNGTFSLLGDYVFQGDQAVVGGAYAYRLYKNGFSTPGDGDWYLRSNLINDPSVGSSPLYAPGVPLYEAYTGVLQSFNQLGTLQQRTGGRSWVAGDSADTVDEGARARGIWGRIEAAHSHLEPVASTTGTDYDANVWKLQTGVDGALTEGAAGTLIGGVSLQYGTVSADVSSLFGTGDIDTTGYGLGGTLTWYGNSGLYIDAQGQLIWYDSDLRSDDLNRTLTDGNDGFGYALSIEAGQKIGLGGQWSLTPQAQLSYSSVRFDDFTDPYSAAVSLRDGDTLIGRLGLSADYDNEWKDSTGQVSRASVYGIANLYYDFLDGSDVDISGTRVVSENRALWGGLGLGGSYSWSDERYSLNGEAFTRTSLQNFGDSYSIGGKLSFNVKW